jgi:hypothetical protein
MLLGREGQRLGNWEVKVTVVTCTTAGSSYKYNLRMGRWNLRRVNEGEDEGDEG